MPSAKTKSVKKAKTIRATAGDDKVSTSSMNDRPARESAVSHTRLKDTGTNAIRTGFLDFFARNDHELMPSSPLVPRNDPTLMFTNAGMVQFKNVLTGAEPPRFPRVATAQKCVRAGGKHNDLDNVGYTARHHTFFEMLGNFSFGDYFKERAILLAWELLTKEFAVDKNRLVVTVYVDDDDAAALAKKITGLPEGKILRIPGSDNFWSMGDTGPCGPCLEIFYDHGPEIRGGPPGSPDADGDRFVEIWNLVFMQYDQLPDGRRVDLPARSIDTGMGLERIAAVLQGTHDNYDIDLFKTLIAASVELTGVAAKGEARPSHRVIADHLRASSFLIADGVLPSNDGRGYVLRRIMRRAMRHAHLLGADEPLLYRLVPTLVAEMGRAYPELERGQSLIVETLKLEETRFRDTLERGLRLLDEATKGMTRGAMLPGEVAFKLYDTYGFPFDLTEDALKPRGISVDTKGFAASMERQRAEARKSWAGSGEAATETLWFELKEALGATEFLGYESEASSGEIVALVKDGKRVEALKAGERGIIIVNQTPFYAESGGQIGDRGVITSPDGARFTVEDTQKKLHGLFLHVGTLESGTVRVGEVVDLDVDHGRRTATRANHSATHLLHEALREVLGEHVAQKGSLVEPGRLRFDFSHPRPMTDAELRAVEDLANDVILQNAVVETHLMRPDEAIAKGALALFGEKYGDEVRVVSMGKSEASRKSHHAYSVELCGGTHVRRTGDIGLLKIVGEGAVASGVRRIEALTGEGARAYLAEQDRRVREAAELLKVSPDEMIDRLSAILDERKRLEHELATTRQKLVIAGALQSEPATIEGKGTVKPTIVRVVPDATLKELRALVDEHKKRLGSGVFSFLTTTAGKASLVVGVAGNYATSNNAVELAEVGSAVLGGRAGGRPDFAQGGGPHIDLIEQAKEAVRKKIVEPTSEAGDVSNDSGGRAGTA